jgi:hypothetical protein
LKCWKHKDTVRFKQVPLFVTVLSVSAGHEHAGCTLYVDRGGVMAVTVTQQAVMTVTVTQHAVITVTVTQHAIMTVPVTQHALMTVPVTWHSYCKSNCST